MVSWGCWAEQPQSCSSSSFTNVTSKEVRVALPGQRQICGSSVSKIKGNSLWLECPDANGPGLLRAGTSGEERCTPHHTVPVSPQCSQEISLLTLPVFQGAALLSVSSTQKCSGAGRLANPSGVFRAARSAISCLERLVPLVSHLAVWEPLPSVSHWVLPERLWFFSLPKR